MSGNGVLARLFPRSPRAVARMLARATDLRVEIIGGSLVLSRTDCPVRADTVVRLAAAIRPHLAEKEWALVRAVPVDMPQDPDDFATPDLLVCAAVSVPSGGRMIGPQDVDLAVEIVPRSEKARGLGRKADWYAVAGVRVLLEVDPRLGSWTLHQQPRGACYRKVLSGAYGEEVPFPGPRPSSLATAGLPRYGP